MDGWLAVIVGDFPTGVAGAEFHRVDVSLEAVAGQHVRLISRPSALSKRTRETGVLVRLNTQDDGVPTAPPTDAILLRMPHGSLRIIY